MTTLFDERELSIWAYIYCKNTKNDPKIKKFITVSDIALAYCVNVSDDPEVRKHIQGKDIETNHEIKNGKDIIVYLSEGNRYVTVSNSIYLDNKKLWLEKTILDPIEPKKEL